MENMNMGSGKMKTELTELEKERIKGRAEAMGILYTLFQQHINGLKNLQGKFFDDIPEMKNMVECFRQSSDMLVDYVFAEAGQGLGLALTSTIEKDNLKRPKQQHNQDGVAKQRAPDLSLDASLCLHP